MKNGWPIIAIRGDFDLNSTQTVKSILSREIDAHPENLKLVVDLGGLEYIDSSGLGVFINLTVRMKALAGTFILMNISAPIAKIFTLTKLNGFFHIVRDETELPQTGAAQPAQPQIMDQKSRSFG